MPALPDGSSKIVELIGFLILSNHGQSPIENGAVKSAGMVSTGRSHGQSPFGNGKASYRSARQVRTRGATVKSSQLLVLSY